MSDVRKTIAGGATWQEVAEDRRRHRDATVAESRIDAPLPEDLSIINTDVEELVKWLASGEWSATIVVRAFLRRAGDAQGMVNCVAELLVDRALERAEWLDRYWVEHKKPVGPLHGIPISVKEHIAMKGLDLNAGFVSWVGRVAEEDALLLQILWDAGAVFYARTTQPQTLMHLETSSNLYGVCANPFNTSLTAGGSSGGEGALIGLRGSVLGIGTDIGGSIRSPAANNGIFGFKPTSERLPTLGWSAPMEGCEAILGTIGPLSTSLEGIKLFMKTAVGAKPWLKSPNLVAMDWRDTTGLFSEKKLKVGVMWDDGVVKPHPPIARALCKVIDKLQKSQKVEVVDWIPKDHGRAWSIIHDVTSLWSACAERDEYRRQYAELWNERGDVDVILCPAGPGVAPKLDAARYWGYTSQWNLLDYPAVAFPIHKCVSVRKDGDAAMTDHIPLEYIPRCEADKDNWSQWELYGAKGYKGAPISLQLVGRRYDDEKLLAALEVILKEADLPTASPPTRPWV
ncbi:amidase [Apiospora rasikravindrae]|uniref:amidase n=1 Tax=Apiospora rasikravindrae TaxID=990691 RepID=A0ABR1U0Q8_9PEZI